MSLPRQQPRGLCSEQRLLLVRRTSTALTEVKLNAIVFYERAMMRRAYFLLAGGHIAFQLFRHRTTHCVASIWHAVGANQSVLQDINVCVAVEAACLPGVRCWLGGCFLLLCF